MESFGDMRFAIQTRRENKYFISLFNLLQTDGDECIREIEAKGYATAIKFLSKNQLVYAWATSIVDANHFSLIDLNKTAGNEHVSELQFVKHDHHTGNVSILRPESLIPLPGTTLGFAAYYCDGSVNFGDFQSNKIYSIFFSRERDEYFIDTVALDNGNVMGMTAKHKIREQSFEWADEGIPEEKDALPRAGR